MLYRHRSWFLSLVLLSLALALPATGLAQTTEIVSEDKVKSSSDGEPQGWNGALSLGANLNLTSNQDVVGQVDGFSTLVGLSANGALDFVSGDDELKNTLSINESFARTPSLERFVKNADTLSLQSLYNHFFVDWAGGFGRFTLDTSLFRTNNVTAERADYVLKRADGTQGTRSGIREFKLADPFSPMSLSESAGVFVEPLQYTPITLTARLGLGARETLAGGVFVVDDNEETETVEVSELESVFQGGFEAFVGLTGSFSDETITYEIGASTLFPVINNDSKDRDAFELMRYGGTGVVSFNAFEWLSINYNLRITRDPQLFDKTQIQNNLLVTFKYNLVERREKELSPEVKLQKAREKAEKANQRVEELESKVEGSASEESTPEKTQPDDATK